MNNTKYHTFGTIPKSSKIICKINTLNTQRRDCFLSWLGTGTSIKSGAIKLVLWTQT